MSATYQVSHRETKNFLHLIICDDGKRRWALRNVDNEEPFFSPFAGLWTTGTLLPGEICTLHETRAAQQLMRWFRSALKQEGFAKIQFWWIGREALAMLRAGKRLATASERSPPEFDLKWPG